MGELTALKVRTAGPGKHWDGEGLRLVVSEGGAKKWLCESPSAASPGRWGSEANPEVSLAEAREEAAKARTAARRGANPIATRRAKPAEVPTFTQAAARFIRAHRRGWRNPKHAHQWVATLKT